MLRPLGLDDPRLLLRAAARDLVTHADGQVHVADEASLAAEVHYDGSRSLRSIELSPSRPRSDELLGRSVASGFRAAATEVLSLADVGGTLALLLDDLPVAVLIAGYANALDSSRPLSELSSYTPKVDLCSGWRSGGTMMLAIDAGRPLPLAVGPEAPDLRGSDAVGWHAVEDLPPSGMRRCRRIDVVDGEVLEVDAMFRDSYVDPDGRQTVVHEYELHATLDREDLVVLDIEAVPRVLPWTECPHAAASVVRLVGSCTDDLAAQVRADFVGTSTCTHLNDLLRSLAGVRALVRALR